MTARTMGSAPGGDSPGGTALLLICAAQFVLQLDNSIAFVLSAAFIAAVHPQYAIISFWCAGISHRR